MAKCPHGWEELRRGIITTILADKRIVENHHRHKVSSANGASQERKALIISFSF